MFHKNQFPAPELEPRDHREAAIEREYDSFLRMRVSDLLKWLDEDTERPVIEAMIESLAEWRVDNERPRD